MWPLLACAPAPDRPDAVLVEVAAMETGVVPTVGTLTWRTDPPTPSAVEFGTSTAYGTRTGIEDGPDHHAVIWGIPERTEVHYRVVDAEGAPLTEDRTWTTGILSLDLPDLDVTGGPDPTGDFLVTSVGGFGYGILVLDADGRQVWGWPDLRGYVVARARLSRDRRAILYDAFWMDLYADLGEIVRVSLDGREVTTVSVPLLSHDFVELPDGTLATYVLKAQDVDGTQYVGDTLVEIAPDGTRRTVWDAWEDPTTPFRLPEDAGDLTWTHANALDYDDERAVYRIGLRNLDTILTVDRASGEVLEHLGGAESDFAFAPGSRAFDGQHQFELTDTRALVFDNGSEAGLNSRAVEYALDREAGTATEVWSYETLPPTYVFAGGDVHRDALGGTRVTWTTSGQIQVLDAADTVVEQIDTPLGYGIAFTTWEAALVP